MGKCLSDIYLNITENKMVSFKSLTNNSLHIFHVRRYVSNVLMRTTMISSEGLYFRQAEEKEKDRSGKTRAFDRRRFGLIACAKQYRRNNIAYIRRPRSGSRMHGIVWRFACPFSSFSPVLSRGTPRLRRKFDIFRRGIWRSNDARAKLSTSIRLFVPNWPSTTPGGPGALAVIGKCLFVLLLLDFCPFLHLQSS